MWWKKKLMQNGEKEYGRKKKRKCEKKENVKRKKVGKERKCERKENVNMDQTHNFHVLHLWRFHRIWNLFSLSCLSLSFSPFLSAFCSLDNHRSRTSFRWKSIHKNAFWIEQNYFLGIKSRNKSRTESSDCVQIREENRNFGSEERTEQKLRIREENRTEISDQGREQKFRIRRRHVSEKPGIRILISFFSFHLPSLFTSSHK